MAEKKTQIYRLENLGCAHCAAEMEQKIQADTGLVAAIVFATRELRLTGADPDARLAEIEQICRSIEADVRVCPASRQTRGDVENKPYDFAEIAVGSLLLLFVVYGEKNLWQLAGCVFAYALLGRKVLWQAGKNILHGRALDENFLMAVATLGAFAIGEAPEGVGVMLFYRLGELFEERAVAKSRRAILAAAELQPDTVHRRCDGRVEEILTAEAVPGDILVVRPGERIPADGRILRGESRIDTAAVTGEPLPLRAEPGMEVLSGYLNTNGLIEIEVLRPASQSMAARILASVESAAAAKPRMERFISRFARVYTPLVVGAALLTAIVPSLFTGEWSYWIYTALTFLVISCPCALVLSVPLAFFGAIGAGSKRGILFKGGAVIESLAKVRQVVFDKTGTLTKGNFAVRQIYCFGTAGESEILRLAAAAELHSTHPLALSVATAAAAAGIDAEEPLAVREIAGRGIEAQLASGEVLCGNEKLLAERGVAAPAMDQPVYGSKIYVARAGTVLGIIVAADALKEEAPVAIDALKQKGLGVSMLTGDSAAAAGAVASQLGIAAVHAGLLPEGKLARLEQLRQANGPALFVGDGINDAPVLAAADCSAAMGSGSAMAVETADIVFLTNRVNAVGQALLIAREARRISWQNIFLAVGAKLTILLLGLFGFASLWLAIFADTGIALLCVLNSVRLLYRQGAFA